jgi:hypothetical protein
VLIKDEHLSESDLAILFENREKNSYRIELEDRKLNHYDACSYCQESFDDLKDFLNANYYRDKKKNNYAYYLIAAAFIFAVLAIKTIFISESDQVRSAENVTYESLVGQKFRSEHTEILSPLTIIIESETIKFEWLSEEEAPFQVIILDNQLNEIKSIKTMEKRLELGRSSLKSGLYYWKLVNIHDLIYVGKFQLK